MCSWEYCLYPLADVQLEVDGLDLTVEAAVSETLPSSVLLGTDVAELATLLGTEACVQPADDHYEVIVVTTRAELAWKKEEERTIQEKEVLSMVRPTPVVQGGVCEETPTQLTKRQRQHIQQSMNKSVPYNDCFLKSVDLSSDEVKRLQEEDDSLSRIRQLTSEGSSDSINQAFVKRDGLYFRKWTPPGRGTGKSSS